MTGTMVGFQDGWETLNLKNAGIDREVGPTGGPCFLRRVQISITMAPSATQATEVGLAQVLASAWITNAAPTFGAQQVPFLAPTNTDWGSAKIINPNGFASEAQGLAGANFAAVAAGNICLPLFAKIMKAEIQDCDEFNMDLWIPSGEVPLPTGTNLILHADHTDWPNDDNNAADLEWQYCVWYEVAG
jgi:hypothetical protein